MTNESYNKIIDINSYFQFISKVNMFNTALDYYM